MWRSSRRQRHAFTSACTTPCSCLSPGLCHRDDQPVCDQRRQLLRVDQRGQNLSATCRLAPDLHLPDRCRRRRVRRVPRELQVRQRMVRRRDLPRDHGPCATTIMAVDHFCCRDGSHLTAADQVPLGADALRQLAGDHLPARRRGLRRDSSAILPSGLNVYDAPQNWGPIRSSVADRGRALWGARGGHADDRRPGASRLPPHARQQAGRTDRVIDIASGDGPTGGMACSCMGDRQLTSPERSRRRRPRSVLRPTSSWTRRIVSTCLLSSVWGRREAPGRRSSAVTATSAP